MILIFLRGVDTLGCHYSKRSSSLSLVFLAVHMISILTLLDRAPVGAGLSLPPHTIYLLPLKLVAMRKIFLNQGLIVHLYLFYVGDIVGLGIKIELIKNLYTRRKYMCTCVYTCMKVYV